MQNNTYLKASLLNKEQQQILLDIASQSILSGLETNQPKRILPEQYSDELQKQRATFVTLNINQQLRGCIGSLSAYQSLVEDVSANAFAAAFSDPRFPNLSVKEFPQLDYHISILSPSKPMIFNSQENLLSQLQPNIDGLILTEGSQRGTFLPSVWEQLSDKKQFLNHLKQKAGLAADYWSDSIQISRYTVESIKS
ncbi:MAG: AmmeMemoRadiSam system protein A [Pseudomonadota bacterium]